MVSSGQSFSGGDRGFETSFPPAASLGSRAFRSRGTGGSKSHFPPAGRSGANLIFGDEIPSMTVSRAGA